jgi:S-adenosylmethionine:tRNA ribosyltransferase-isomerase
MVQRARRHRPSFRYRFEDGLGAEIVACSSNREEGELRFLKFDRPVDDAWLDLNGHVPLPPYIRRQDSVADIERYQTIYAQELGSTAAPTAGLHFTRELLGELTKAGVESAFITLHVGPGTFLPVRTENIREHKMHEESYSISCESARCVERAKAEGRKLLAVGTTSVRALESAWMEDQSLPGNGTLRIGEGRSSLFIYPGYNFKLVDALFTNFHTPGSTLLMLVSAFAGRDFVLESYKEAVKEGYRFFSYGDACLIL